MKQSEIIPGRQYKHDWFLQEEYFGAEKAGRKFLLLDKAVEVGGIEQLNAEDLNFWSKFHLVKKSPKVRQPIQIKFGDKTA